MGTCFSSSSSDLRQPAANVVSATGDLHQFETPITVSEVFLRLSQISSSSSSLSKKFFISNSDFLSYDNIIPAMSSEEELIADQIYFLFPYSKLNCCLSASDMAALAVKASLALGETSKISIKSKTKSAPSQRRVQNKISPYFEQELSITGCNYNYNYTTVKSGDLNVANKPAVADGLMRSGSLKKLQRYSSKRAKMAARSFRLRLSTIHEGFVA